MAHTTARHRPGLGAPSGALVSLTILLMTAAAPAAAQSACKGQLEQADESFHSGRFPEAVEAARGCLAARPSRSEKARALSIVAKTQLADDDLAAARRTIAELLRADPGFEPELRDAPRFARLLGEQRKSSGDVQVVSVSKTPESLREAPATVLVVTAREIERRGYLDLEAVFHDLPGFDISRGNGVAYSNLYQRGYLSSTTDRTLFLVDGVENNDLTSNVAFISHQYPLSAIDRIEVIYGPASTMYGANAFVGVINVILKEPEALLRDGRQLGGQVQMTAGSLNVRSLETTLAGRTAEGGLSWSLTGRNFRSDEVDLSGYPDWDYSPAVFATVDYTGKLALRDPAKIQAFLSRHGAASDLYQVQTGPDGGVTAVVPTARAAELARGFDGAAMTQELNGHRIGFSDLADDRWLSGMVKTANLKLGFQLWTQKEGDTSWYTDQQHPGARNGALWSPRQVALSARYSRQLLDDLTVEFFSRYKQHDLAPGSTSISLRSYATGQLGLEELLRGTASGWQTTYLNRSSNQLQNELSASWQPSDRFSLVSGVEVRYGSIQGDYTRSTTPVAAESGTVQNAPAGGNQFTVRDAGFYAQASFRPLRSLPDLKMVAGGRLDDNLVRESGGYGAVFTPRLAVIYSPGRAVVKAIYSEAFKDASNFNKYSTTQLRLLPNPTLQPEKVKNVEVSAGWQAGDLSGQIAAYQALYSGVLGLRSATLPDGTATTQFQDAGRLRIRGVQADGTFRFHGFELFGNYTYTQPYNIAPSDDRGEPLRDARGNVIRKLRIGDIAAHQANLGVSATWRGSLTTDLRLRYVGDRPTGIATTTQTNPFSKIDGYLTLNGAVSFKHAASGLKVQLSADNLLDRQYFDPGVRQAGRDYAARIPQAGRTVNLRIVLAR
jgi:outer membrane receptor for ferrienterochelin and colicins